MDIWQTLKQNKDTMLAYSVAETVRTEARRLRAEQSAMERAKGNAQPSAEYKTKWNALDRDAKKLETTEGIILNILKGQSPLAK
jgi:hypothetical protein